MAPRDVGRHVCGPASGAEGVVKGRAHWSWGARRKAARRRHDTPRPAHDGKVEGMSRYCTLHCVPMMWHEAPLTRCRRSRGCSSRCCTRRERQQEEEHEDQGATAAGTDRGDAPSRSPPRFHRLDFWIKIWDCVSWGITKAAYFIPSITSTASSALALMAMPAWIRHVKPSKSK